MKPPTKHEYWLLLAFVLILVALKMSNKIPLFVTFAFIVFGIVSIIIAVVEKNKQNPQPRGREC